MFVDWIGYIWIWLFYSFKNAELYKLDKVIINSVTLKIRQLLNPHHQGISGFCFFQPFNNLPAWLYCKINDVTKLIL